MTGRDLLWITTQKKRILLLAKLADASRRCRNSAKEFFVTFGSLGICMDFVSRSRKGLYVSSRWPCVDS
jgi:hypothetical protein